MTTSRTRITDLRTRPQSIEEAEAQMQIIAEATAHINSVAAHAEEQINEIKANLQTYTDEQKEVANQLLWACALQIGEGAVGPAVWFRLDDATDSGAGGGPRPAIFEVVEVEARTAVDVEIH